MEKPAVREEARRRLAAIPAARRALEEELVTAAAQATQEWRRAGTILFYRSVAPEFSTVGLVNAAWRSGKRTVFPVVEGERLVMRAASAWMEFKVGWRGIPEPTGEPVRPGDVELAFVPGVAFTDSGLRLGRGGGHYDRLLGDLTCPVWGLGFDVQVLAELPTEPHDRRVGHVLHAESVASRGQNPHP